MDLLEKSVRLTLYTDGDCYLYKPDNIDGYLLLNYEDLTRNIFYKFIYDKIGDNFKKLKDDKQTALSLYNMFYKYIDNEQDIEVYNLSEHDDNDSEYNDEEDNLINKNPLEEEFGYIYDIEKDVFRVNSLVGYHIN
jgi:hypothetical protein